MVPAILFHVNGAGAEEFIVKIMLLKLLSFKYSAT